MKFRTPIEPLRGVAPIDHSQSIVMIGSCFSSNIGSLLLRDGFNVSVNEMGVLYNPASIAAVCRRALDGTPFTVDDLVEENGTWHCLWFESRRQHTDPAALLESLNRDFATFASHLRAADVWFVTFGTAWVFELLSTGDIVGNCHKLPASSFRRTRLGTDDIVRMWKPFTEHARRRIVFTVSPIRHLADGLHGNALSKATLLLATEQLGEYFPAYEIMNDDLRDYRFYAADMKHPSDTAVEYIYEIFRQTYFTASTEEIAAQNRRQAARSNHRQIISNQ